jgi:hypothetical protein
MWYIDTIFLDFKKRMFATVIFLVVLCMEVSAQGSCAISPDPSAEGFFNVEEKKFSVTSTRNKAAWGTIIVFYPTDGAGFDLSTGEISVHVDLNMDCGPNMCSGMAYGSYSMEEYCEDNGGRISCKVFQWIDPDTTCAGSPPINSTCLPDGHETSNCLGISAHVNSEYISTNWGFDSSVHQKSLSIKNSTEMMVIFNNNTNVK